MERTFNIPLFILTISCIIGIVFGYFTTIQITTLFTIQIVLLIGLAFSWKYTNRPFKKSYVFTIIAILNFTVIGALLVAIHHPNNNPNHYTKLIPQNTSKNTTIKFCIKKRLKPTSYYEKYIISIKILEKNNVSGDLLLQIPKEQIKTPISTGDCYVTHANIVTIPTPLNPNQFNYAAYLQKEYIFHKITVNYSQLLHINQTSLSIYKIAHNIRFDIQQKLKTYSFTQQQLSIINALILGQRQDIDIDLITDYQNAGAIHLLAVSGLHIGILLTLLNFLLSPLLYLKQGKKYRTILVIIALWCFAIIAGLSPSILRAVTMFTFVTIGIQANSKSNTYNALLFSIFLLICFDPLLIFSVGFQLSYIAVFSILWIQPLVSTIYNPRFYVDKLAWNTLTVTIAAQLGVLPITLFYFHQFPLLFFVANLLIVPFLGIILGLGILQITLASFNIQIDWLVILFGNSIDCMNYIVQWVSKQEEFIITHISFSWRMLLVTYLFIICIIIILKKYSLQKLYYLVISILLFLGILLYEKRIHMMNRELIVFHHQKSTIIGVLQNRKLHIHTNSKIYNKLEKILFDNYTIYNNAKYMGAQKLNNVYEYRNRKILIVDQSNIYQIEKLIPDIIILSNSPKIHLERLITQLQPKLIIADGSNYISYLNQWERTCNKTNTSFHRTDKNGAFILNE